MQKYVGTKIINAVSMNREEYNDLRGWELPEDENGADEGYLVENPDSSPNVKGFDGYISWSPKQQFEAAYLPVETELDKPYQVRVVAESVQLSANIDKLGAFIASDAFGELSPAKADLMRRQFDYMNMYASILRERIGLEQLEE